MVAFFAIASALMLGTILAVFVSKIFFESSGESQLMNPDESKYPTLSPTYLPSFDPTNSPSNQPSLSAVPTSIPSWSPSSLPSMQPTLSKMPSTHPSMSPTISSEPSAQPSASPSVSSEPSSMPSSEPSFIPTSQPSASPTLSTAPSSKPSQQPTLSTFPSSQPSLNPTISSAPSSQPSLQPTLSSSPSTTPSMAPSTSTMPTDTPSSEPTSVPSTYPTRAPSISPTSTPSLSPSNAPSMAPTSKKIFIVLNGEDQRSTNLVMVGGAYVFVLASVGYYLFRREQKAKEGDESSEDPSISNASGADVEAGILGIAPPPQVKNTPAKSVSRRILSPLKSFSSVRSLSPLKGLTSFRGRMLKPGAISISSGESDLGLIPAIQESCSIDSSETKVKLSSVDSLEELMESSLPAEKQTTENKTGKLPPPRDSLDALMEHFSQQKDGCAQTETIKKPASNLDQIGSASKAPRLAYENELINSRQNADFSFRDIFFDPENELYECRVPSGKLGIVVDETGIGPRVQKVDALSKLYRKISVGDIIIAVDEVDLVGAKPDTFWQLVSRKANKQERCIVVLKI